VFTKEHTHRQVITDRDSHRLPDHNQRANRKRDVYMIGGSKMTETDGRLGVLDQLDIAVV
jgi:hypothetical protein